MTERLNQVLQMIGLATSGSLGARLAAQLGISVSWMTILRRIMGIPTPDAGAVTILGIDDWSFRRGRKFGTILVDLTRHRVIDLLPDRQAETAKIWMQVHPEIELVSRDRGGDYATAAHQGAPQAIQSADRFHLVKNLAEAVEKALAQCRAEIRRSSTTPASICTEAPEGSAPALVTSDGQPYSAHQVERYDRYQQVVTLRKHGMKIKEIAKRVGLGRRTIQRWLSEEAYPETNYHHPHRSRFDDYAPYVKQRWDGGCHNLEQIWREIRSQGYPHSSQALRRKFEPLRGRVQASFPEASSLDRFSAKKAVWLFIRPLDDLDAKEREELATIRQASETAETLYQLVQEFLQMVRKAGILISGCVWGRFFSLGKKLNGLQLVDLVCISTSPLVSEMLPVGGVFMAMASPASSDAIP